MSFPATYLECSGCDGRPAADDPYPFRCPNAATHPGTDHVLARVLKPPAAGSPEELQAIFEDAEPNPFLRYRRLLHTYHWGRQRGLGDADYVEVVQKLDEAVRAVDGHPFRVTPFLPSPALSSRLGLGSPDAVWVKNETGNVSGSHKARHLMGIMIWLRIVERLGLDRGRPRKRLAIASCGNAALAAAVVAKAAGWPIDVYVPPEAHPAVVARLRALDAHLITCAREGNAPGDPCFLRFTSAVAGGSLPFTCQGNVNGLTLEGGATLGYEMISTLMTRGTTIDRLLIQVGGGALGSSCFRAFEEGARLGLLKRMPRIHAVQTRNAHPLERAWRRVAGRVLDRARRDGLIRGAIPGDDAWLADRIRADVPGSVIEEELRQAAANRSDYMWPWESVPKSVATGILDDETYDWLAVVRGMLLTGGWPVLASEEELTEANAIARESTGIPVDVTGSSGLAGCIEWLQDRGRPPGETVALLFTGVDRGL